jgi:hypothetical protein
VNAGAPPANLRLVRVVAFLGLTLVFPCPWYMIAVGGLLPLPVIALYGLDGGIVLVFSVLHIVLYGWLFLRLARWVGGWVHARRIHGAAAAALLGLMSLGMGFVPIYGAGENLLGGGGLWGTAYGVYWSALREVFALLRR